MKVQAGIVGALVHALILVSTLGAQVSSPLPADHWAVAAARRVEALGLGKDYLPAQGAVPLLVVQRALREAAERAPFEAPHLAELVGAWEQRFRREFPHGIGDSAPGGYPRLQQGALGLASGWRDGVVRPGRGVFALESLDPVPDQADAGALAALSASLTPWLSVFVAPEFGSRDGLDGTWDATVGWRSVAVSAGRQRVVYGPGERSVVLGSPEAWHRVQVETIQPWTLPGPLRVLGPAAFHTSAGRVFSDRHPGHPFLWTASARARPHPRITAAVNRAAMLGGDSVSVPITARNLLRVVGGWQTGGFENQIVSLELGYRLPTEQWLPVSGYIEWGFDDAAGAISDVPGYVTGAFAPALPGFPQAALGVEHASFAHSCCGNPPWYRHSGHPGGWAYDQIPLGHPLGGNGSEWLAWVQVDPVQSPLSWDTRFWLRRRGGENLYAPDRIGRSVGGAGQVRVRARSRLDAHLTVSHEAGDGWRESHLRAGLAKFF